MSRELDLEIAEKVLGWRWLTGRLAGGSIWNEEQQWLLPADMILADVPKGVWTYYTDTPDGRFTLITVPRSSSDMGAAWQVVERLLAGDSPWARWKLSFGLEYSSVVDWVADFTPRRNHPQARDYEALRASAVLAPEAICLAALRTLETLKEETP